jgi:hypothetical protein
MSFAAMAGWQAWLVIGVAVAAAAGLFLLKLRPPQITVPSLILWRKVLDERRDRTLWERIRRAVSLLVALLVTVAIALAILRPQPGSAAARAAAAPGRVAIVIDSSWSMLAQTSSGGTRWDRAIARARALATAAAGEDIALSTTADGLVEGPTPDAALIEAALDHIAPSGGEAAAWPGAAGARVTYFLTDGAIARPMDAGVIVESVFEPAANVAITAFDVRPAATPDQAGRAFLEVANYSTAAQDVRMMLARGAASVLDVTVTLAAGAAVQRIVPLDRAGAPQLRARISARQNALVVDDEAVAWIRGVRPLAVTVVSDQPAPLVMYLRQVPGITATAVAPNDYTPGRADLVVFDRVLPAAPPAVPALLVAPPGASWLGTPGAEEREPQWAARQVSPLLQSVDLLTMPIERARQYAGPGLTPLVFSTKSTPLVLAGEAPDRRLLLFTFSFNESKSTFAPGFPVLMDNVIEWLTNPAAGTARRPGPAVFPAGLTSLLGPDGKNVPIAKVGAVAVATLARVGFYDAAFGGATSVVPVTAGDPETSDLRRTRLAGSARTDAAQAPSRGRPWWLIAAAAAIALLSIEWWTWQRRITV